MPIYLPVGLSEQENQDYHTKYHQFVKLLINEFNGRAHWGKNKEWAFVLQTKNGVFRENLTKFQEVLNKWDPNGLFSNEYGKTLGLKWPNLKYVEEESGCSSTLRPVCSRSKNTRFRNLCIALDQGLHFNDLGYCKN